MVWLGLKRKEDEEREGDGDGERRIDAEPRLPGAGLAALLTLPGNT